jgi:cytochrome c
MNRRSKVKTSALSQIVISVAFGVSAALAPSVSGAADNDAAKALWKRNDCNKCHAKSRDKKGPSIKKMAKQLKQKATKEKKDVETLAIDQMTKGLKVKLLDSDKEEDHKVIDTKDPKEMKNLAAWLLAH